MPDHDDAQQPEADRELREAYRAVLASPAGQRVVADMLVFCRMFENPLVLGEGDGKTLYQVGVAAYPKRFLALSGGLDAVFRALTGEPAPIGPPGGQAITEDTDTREDPPAGGLAIMD